jgi:uncharacterized membrane protein
MPSKSTEILTKAATEFAAAKASDVVTKLGERASGAVSGNGKDSKSTENDNDDNGDNGENGNGENGDDNKGFIGTAASKLGEGAGPIKSLVSGAGAAIKGIFKRKGGSKRPHNIVEDCFVGVTPDVAFAAWTQFEEFSSFMKGAENVARGEEIPEDELEEDQDPHEGEEMNWSAKIWWSKRSWKSTTIDYDEPNRISWKSEGAKGTVDGTITFTAIGENATLMLFVLEYRSKGPIEWIGNRWRTVGRRVRLDIKHFRRYVMRTEPDELPEPEGEGEEEPEEQPEDVTDETQGEEEVEDEDDEEPDEEEPDEGAEEDEEDEEDFEEEEEDSEEEPEEEEVPEPEPAPRRTVKRSRARTSA